MIHYVVLEVDRGAPIVVQEVDIKTGDSLETLQVGDVRDVDSPFFER